MAKRVRELYGDIFQEELRGRMSENADSLYEQPLEIERK